MCEPSTLFGVGLALSAAQAAASHISATQEADAQRRYQEAQMRAHNEAALHNANAAIKEQNDLSAAERQQQMEHQAVAAREKQKIQQDFLEKKGAAIASSPYGNGLSYDSLLADYDRAFAMSNDVVDEQLTMQGIAADTNIRGYRDRTQNRIDSQQGYISAPIPSGGGNYLASALGFAGNAFGHYNAATNFGKDPLFQKGAPSDTTATASNAQKGRTTRSTRNYNIKH